MDKKLRRLKKNPLERRLAFTLNSMRAGGSVMANRAANWWQPEEKRAASRSAALAKEAKRFCQELGELKGSYVKIGQMLALFGEHLLPPELTEALHQLHDQTIALDWPQIEPQLQEQLGSKLKHLTIEPDAFAAASLGQVHRAAFESRDLCLKVQYPGISQSIDSDFNDVIRLLQLARWLPNTSEIGDWLSGVKQLLKDEINYQREAEMTELVRQKLGNDPRYRIPNTHAEFCSQQILAMDYVEGFDVTSTEVQQLHLERRNALGKAMLELFFSELYHWGIMQTDPNFGNYRIQIGEDSDQIILLDFGAVRAFPENFLKALGNTIAAAHSADRDGIRDGLIALQCLKTDSPQEAIDSFVDFCILLTEPLHRDISHAPDYALNKKGTYRWGESKLLKRAGKYAKNSSLSKHFILPPKEFIFIVRKLTGVFSFISVLGAEFNGYEVLQPFIRGTVKTPEELPPAAEPTR